MNLPLLPQDKANHVVYGAGLCAVVASLAVVAGAAAWAAALIGATLALLAGLLKEQLDARANRQALAAGQPAPHGVESADVVATFTGGLLVAVPLAVAGLAALPGTAV